MRVLITFTPSLTLCRFVSPSLPTLLVSDLFFPQDHLKLLVFVIIILNFFEFDGGKAHKICKI